MIKSEKRVGERFYLLGVGQVAEYTRIPSDDHPVSNLYPLDEIQVEYRSAVIHNISQGGICISIKESDLDVGTEIGLFFTVMARDPDQGNIAMEFVARVVWISDDTTGFRAGLEFSEVPEDFAEAFSRLTALLEKEHAFSR
jgi:c-di-GMP-binding flagellar brake protein YcgR